MVKNAPAKAEDVGSIPGWGDPMEKEMEVPSSILAWEIPWTEEPGGLQSMGLQRVRLSEHKCMNSSIGQHSPNHNTSSLFYIEDISHPIYTLSEEQTVPDGLIR